MEIAWILGGLFLFCTMGFVVVAVFLPELVGIQGRKSQEIEAQHRSTEAQVTEAQVTDAQVTDAQVTNPYPEEPPK